MSIKNEVILIIDAGSSSIRASLVSLDAKLLFTKQITYSVIEYPDGRVEQTVGLFHDHLCAAVSASSARARELDAAIIAVGVTAQRSSVVPVDRTGQPLANFIMWHDKRTVDICDEANARCDVYSICGMTATHVYSAPKIAWFHQNCRDIYDKTYKFIGVQDLLLFLMTGRFVTDVSFASRTALLDIRTRMWSPALLELFHVDQTKLCDIIEVGSQAGSVTAEWARATGLSEGIPVFSAGGDQQCAALGLNLTAQGQVMVNTGTGAYVVGICDRPLFDGKKRVLCNASAIPGKWILEASSMSSGMVFNWFNTNFYSSHDQSYPFEHIESAICASPPGANGIVMIPCLLGKGTPFWNPYVRGLFCNITYRAGKQDFARALIEGLAAELSDCTQLFEELLGVDTVISSGGLSKFHIYNQILADTMGREILVSSIPETTTFGAWVSTATAIGAYPDFQTAHKKIDLSCSLAAAPVPENHLRYTHANEARSLLLSSIDFEAIYRLLQ